MATVNLQAAPRTGAGKGFARKLRQADRIPVVLYGHQTEPTHLSVDAAEFRRAMSTGAGSRAVIQLQIEGAKNLKKVAIVKEQQRHPVSRKVTHVDLLAIDLTQPVEVSIPIKAVGIPVGVRMDGGVLEWQRRELDVRVLPTAIPEEIELDVTDLKINHAIHIGDVKAEGFELLEAPEMTICSVASTRLVEETAAGEEPAEGVAAAESSKDGDDD